MATTVTKTIGSAGRDYATIQAFFDAVPADLVALDQVWEGVIYPDDGNEIPNAGFVLTARTTDATRFVRLTVAAGFSFIDHVNKLTNELRPNAANGVLISTPANGLSNCIQSACRLEVTRLQIHNRTTMSGGPFCALTSAAQVITARDCILQSSWVHPATHGLASTSAIRLYNVLSITGGGGGLSAGGTVNQNIAKGCTFVAPPGSANRPVTVDYNPQPLVKDCAFFGYTLSPNAGGGFATGSSGNATDLATLPSGMTGTTGLSYAAQFQNTDIAGGTCDFRPKAGNGLANAGVPDADIPNDIFGRARNAVTPTVGVMEFVPTGSSATISGTLGAITGAFAGSGSVVSAAAISSALAAVTGSIDAIGYAGAASATLTATLDNVTGVISASGSAGVSGTLTVPALKNKSGTVWANVTGITAVVVRSSDLGVVTTKTGLSTNASGVLTIADNAIIVGTEYIVLLVTSSKAHGSAKLTAA